MKLFPHVLIRVAGGPFESLERLRLPETAQIANEIHVHKTSIKRLKERLSEALYEVIGAQTDNAIRVSLINLRRDIFNEREVPLETLAQVGPHLPQEVYAAIKQYIEHQEDIDRLWQKGEATYRQELEVARHHLHDLIEADNLQKGLILSSQSLLKHGIPSYLSRDTSALTSQDKKTELSLIKYIARIYAKTSPFSTFTHLALGEITSKSANGTAEPARSGFDNPTVLYLPGSATPKVISHIRLNNYLYKYLQDLFTHYPAIYRHFLVRPNPTLTKEEDHYLFLTNSNNVESFQRIPLNPVLDLFQFLTSAERAGVVYKDVVQTIIDNEYIDAPAEEIEAYMDQLIAYGFLEFNIGVSGVDPDWDLKLRQKLSHLRQEVPLLGEVLDTLAYIRELADQYGQAGVPRRQQILTEAYERFKATCMRLHETAGLPEEERLSPEEAKSKQSEQEEAETEEAVEAQEEETENPDEVFKHQATTRFYFRPEQIFYEDTALEGAFTLNPEGMTMLVSALYHLYREIRLFEGYQDERDKMYHYFAQQHGHRRGMSLLAFYEGYYREVKKPAAERASKKGQTAQEKQAEPGEQNNDVELQEADQAEAEITEPDEGDDDILTVPAIQARHKQTEAWLEQLATIVKAQTRAGDEQINLCLEQVQQTNEAIEMPGDTGKPNGSYGIFVQLFQTSNGNGQPHLMGVLNGSFPGYGKMVSRFLHLFDGAFTRELRGWNQSLSQEALFIEDCDASYFNANLHPPLMPFEIWIPGGHNSLPAQQQIAVTELQVGLDETGQQVQLIHTPSQKRGYVFDLGFQGHGGRSQLFQLLDKFTGARYLSPYPLRTAVSKLWDPQETEQKESPQNIHLRPRIVYDGRLVLQRQAWLVPKALLPFRQPEESDSTYSIRLQAWRLEHRIPDEVFVYIFGRGTLQNVELEERQRIGRDDYKPQYICFENPFLVTLFEKLLRKVPATLTIEEMLPNSEQLLAIGEHRHVTEFVLQWYDQAEDT